MVAGTKVTCKRSGNRLPSFDPHSPLLSTPGALFDINTKGADGAADLLEVLRNSPLEKLNFKDCDQIPSTAWQKLRGASWTNLREANFDSCLVLQTWLRWFGQFVRSFFPQIAIAIGVLTSNRGGGRRTTLADWMGHQGATVGCRGRGAIAVPS